MESGKTSTEELKNELKEQPNITLFDALIDLQSLCKMELDLKQTFGRLLDD